MNDEHCIILSTCPDRENAERIASAVVEQGVAACVNIIPALTSVFLWKGNAEKEEELLLLIKTRRDAYAKLEQAIIELHPYELPEVVAVPMVAGLGGYLEWIDETVTASGAD